MLLKYYTQYVSDFGKLSSGHRTGKGQYVHSIPKKDSAEEYSNCWTIALILNASKVTFKILQARLQQYVNREIPDVQNGLRKGRGGSGWGTHIHPWLIHVNVWQNHHNIVK